MEVLEAARATTAPTNELDEAFLANADRAVLVSKVLDPLRLDQVHRAAEYELRMNRNGAD